MIKQTPPASFAVLSLVVFAISGCWVFTGNQPASRDIDRLALLPVDTLKVDHVNNPHPPFLHTSGYAQEVPIPSLVNTAGAEDAPLIWPDGQTLNFFITPDALKPPEEQLTVDATGIYASQKHGDAWGNLSVSGSLNQASTPSDQKQFFHGTSIGIFHVINLCACFNLLHFLGFLNFSQCIHLSGQVAQFLNIGNVEPDHPGTVIKG